MKNAILNALYKVTMQIKNTELNENDITVIRDMIKDCEYEIEKKVEEKKEKKSKKVLL